MRSKIEQAVAVDALRRSPGILILPSSLLSLSLSRHMRGTTAAPWSNFEHRRPMPQRPAGRHTPLCLKPPVLRGSRLSAMDTDPSLPSSTEPQPWAPPSTEALACIRPLLPVAASSGQSCLPVSCPPFGFLQRTEAMAASCTRMQGGSTQRSPASHLYSSDGLQSSHHRSSVLRWPELLPAPSHGCGQSLLLLRFLPPMRLSESLSHRLTHEPL